jgi:DNA-binding transcriptional regulator LsrR (DeoR family)
MTIGSYIKEELKAQGRTQRWLAHSMEISEKVLSRKLQDNTLSAAEIVKIAIIIDIDLNVFKIL